MKKLKKGRKLGREKGQRKSLMKTMANSLILHEKITTTEAKAKELRPFVERLVTYGKKQNVSGLRQLMKKVNKTSAYKMYHEIAPRYENRNGGYTRIIKKTGRRKQDGSREAIIEFV